MSEGARRRMMIGEFLAWQSGQDDRYELVQGEPVRMTGARLRHDLVAGNAMFEIRRQLRMAGNPCDAFSDDICIITPAGNLRRPDGSVLCPPFDLDAMTSDRPRLVLEVLLESTETVDRLIKLDEYNAIDSLDHIIIAVPTRVEVAVWFRDAERAWQHKLFTDPTVAIEMPTLSLSLGLSALYERVPLVPRTGPRLVWEDGADTRTR
jgi:Uma2 family endonuclease